MPRTFRIIKALPGRGRSQFILREILSRVRRGEIPPESALVLTPTIADAHVLSARFDRLAVDWGGWVPVQFDTMQGIARQVLSKDPEFAYHRPMDDMEERLVLQTLVVRELSDEGRESSGLSSNAYADAVSLRSQSFIEDVHAFVAELKQHRVAPASDHPGSAATYEEFISSLPQQNELRAIGVVYAKYQEILRKEQRYDAQGILWNAYVAAADPKFLDRLPPYRLVYYDDAQDMSALEAELLVRILRPDSELVLTHCPHTAAFRFRYALRDPVASLSSLLSQQGDPTIEWIEDGAKSPTESPTPSRPLSHVALDFTSESGIPKSEIRNLYRLPSGLVPMCERNGTLSRRKSSRSWEALMEPLPIAPKISLSSQEPMLRPMNF
ncbi:MAG: UvrD-helicase domain-containing protein [bacterium]